MVLTTISALSSLENFCITYLEQTADDTYRCSAKVGTISFKDSRDDALIAYLCCLGAWNDVTHNYSVYLDSTFLQYVSYQTNDTVLLNIANFVKMCTANADLLPVLTTDNFLYWGNHSHVVANCRQN
ncbi:unnamed protein product [Lymnaea stagnalis]|uniref:Uncharacterized protein n=1 Tax=Lymnaea stagnalis TaxID=6523 RepID=A0AAV2I065_LYMST